MKVTWVDVVVFSRFSLSPFELYICNAVVYSIIRAAPERFLYLKHQQSQVASFELKAIQSGLAIVSVTVPTDMNKKRKNTVIA